MTTLPAYQPDRIEDMTRMASYLLGTQAITPADLARAVAFQRAYELRFGEALVQMGLVTPTQLQLAMSSPAQAAAAPSGEAVSAIAIHRDPTHARAAAISALRAELLLRQADQTSNAIAVMSASQGDGRSSLAAELAIAFSQLGQATLLVDADVRRPAQHRLFQTTNAPGLLHQLADGTPPTFHAIAGLPDLSVLTSGVASNGPELLSLKPFAELVRGWRSRYRHIVVDTSATTSGPEAYIAASAVGSAVLLARRDHSPMGAMKETQQRLQRTSIRLLGCVMQ